MTSALERLADHYSVPSGRGRGFGYACACVGTRTLDFSGVKGRERLRYFEAVHAAMAGNLAPMMFVFERIVARTQRKQRS